ncbi:hypothetical protein KTAU_01940 [Thermogemmatispora aurantia]|uniref:Uncharacterized protein n=1 Tax=Thermogemmatispora aurantia TaxID=2045279 RepID=A0A5J4K5Y5_9CHLR|nr:hypothetical protein KTAU_01940 [Thermogemmatispora aurantia]
MTSLTALLKIWDKIRHVTSVVRYSLDPSMKGCHFIDLPPLAERDMGTLVHEGGKRQRTAEEIGRLEMSLLLVK